MRSLHISPYSLAVLYASSVAIGLPSLFREKWYEDMQGCRSCDGVLRMACRHMYVCMYNVLGTVWGNRQISVHAEHMAGLVIARTSFTRIGSCTKL